MILFPDDIPHDKLPTVGIIIANYNYGDYVSESIESALAQKYPKIVILIVDDFSTDNSRVEIDKTMKKHCSNIESHAVEDFDIVYGPAGNKEVVYIRTNRHINVSAARNVAIDISLKKVDYYMVLDADDKIYDNKVSELAAALFMSSNIGVSYADYYIHNVETGTTIPEFKEPFDRKRLERECIVHSGSMIRKQALLDCKDSFGYYDVNMRTCEDYDLWMRISEKYMIVHIPKLLSFVRVHRKNSTSVITKQEWEHNWRRIIEKTNLRHAQTGI